jgi:hypothetical protein
MHTLVISFSPSVALGSRSRVHDAGTAGTWSAVSGRYVLCRRAVVSRVASFSRRRRNCSTLAGRGVGAWFCFVCFRGGGENGKMVGWQATSMLMGLAEAEAPLETSRAGAGARPPGRRPLPCSLRIILCSGSIRICRRAAWHHGTSRYAATFQHQHQVLVEGIVATARPPLACSRCFCAATHWLLLWLPQPKHRWFGPGPSDAVGSVFALCRLWGGG